MRVTECNICGEALSAANDQELEECVRAHLDAEHSGEDADASAMLAQAYDATDS